jgi:hypothetical protein
VNCLVVATDQGVKKPESSVLNTEENRAVGVGLIPLVEPSRYGGEEFLRFLGATLRIEEIWLGRLAETATRAATDEEFISLAGVAMRLAARLAKRRPEGRNWIRTARIFCHWQTRALSSYDDWRTRGGDKGFSAVVANEVMEALESVCESSVADLMDDLFKLGDLGGRNSEVIAWLRRVNDHGRKNEMGLEFANRLRGQGLAFSGNTIQEPSHLPLVWDGFPNPCSSFGFVILPDKALDRSACERAAQLLGWPCLSVRPVEFMTASRERIDELAARQLQFTSNVLESKFSEAQGNRPSNSSILRKAREGRLTVFEATDISLHIEDFRENPEVDFWSTGDILLFDSDKITLAEAFGRMIDAQASTTVAPFIEGIFDQQKSAAKQSVSKNEQTSFPGGANSASSGLGKSGESEKAGDSSEKRSGSNEALEAPTGPRKRLYSYVVRNGGYAGSKSGRDASAAEKHRDEVEVAGEELLKRFCQENGLSCLDVTAENKGYDFEIHSGEEVFFVELKTSREQWSHWENSMTRNELKSAIDNSENYILCVAERVFEADATLTFIRNPWGLADGFLFDSPWKKTAVDPAELFSLLEESCGVPPPSS